MPIDPADTALLTDLYQLNMVQTYLEHGQAEVAVFELFVRRLPGQRGFLMAAGLEQALDYLEGLRFSVDEIAWLRDSGRFRPSLLDRLADFRFTGEAHAMPEGTVFFADEPILRITAPLPEAQLVETRLINILNFQSMVASKAARMRLAAPGKVLVDFGLRRAHGAEAGLMAARAAYLAGFSGTATVLAGRVWDIPLFGTMAHSFIEASDDEAKAFEDYARSHPEGLVLLIDTYDTEAAARKVVELLPRLKAAGVRVQGVRLDSGDLASLSKRVRQILDEGGGSDVTIFASGGLDEGDLLELAAAGAPIDGFGMGTSLVTSGDAPSLDSVYKLEEYAGAPRRKLSPGKQTWPGRKQVWRSASTDGRFAGDVLTLEGDERAGEPLLQPVMRGGRRLFPSPSLAQVRARAAEQLRGLPEPLRRLQDGVGYRVEVSESLRQLTDTMDRRPGRRS